MRRRRPPLLLLLFLFALTRTLGQEDHAEDFSESLLLRPLPDRKLLSHFHFRTTAPSAARHHRLFPKSISHLIHKFNIRELELSFTQGRWNYERWGSADPMARANAKPPGVELWTTFRHLDPHQIDATWKDLTHALSGLFCASLNFLESPASHASPRWAFVENSGNLRYGALPREAVCTENLTPWLKLLPCRDKAGIASLLDRPSIYRGIYHSQRLRVSLIPSGAMAVEQTLTVVLQPDERKLNSPLQPDWSLLSLFHRRIDSRCVLAKSSSVFVELAKGLVKAIEEVGPGGSWDGLAFELSGVPDRVLRKEEDLGCNSTSVLYEFDVLKYGKKEAFDIGFSWKRPLFWSSSNAPLQANRFLIGSGNERGSIAIRFIAMQTHELLESKGGGCIVDVSILQIVPWYVKVYYHTLKVLIDGRIHDISNVVEKFFVSPSEDKLSPGVMELMLKLPCEMKSALLTIDFDKGFLHIDEYPPDANQGFDIPSAIVSFPNFSVSGNIFSPMKKYSSVDDSEERHPVRAYTEILLVPLTTPDFSMPYNVITFTCTVLALYFGSLLNVLRRRVGSEEGLITNAAGIQGLLPNLLSKVTSKLRGETSEPSRPSSPTSLLNSKQFIKMILVALVAVLWYYFQKDQ